MNEFISFVIAGLVTGSIYAVTASGLVVTYKSTGVFNFAHGAVGMLMAYLYWQLWQGWGWNPVLSLVIVLFVVAPAFALLVERVLMRPLYGAALSTMIVVTLGLFLVLYGLVSTIWDQTITRNLPQWFLGDQVTVFGVTLTYEDLITIGCAVVVALALWALFRLTRVGVSMRAVVDDPSLASLTGARTNRIAGFAWIVGFMLAGLAGILLAPGSGMSIAILSELVIFGYAAAIVGRLSSLPYTFLGAMILGVGESLSVGYVPASYLNYVTEALPMGLLIVALLLLPQSKLTVGRVVRLRPPKPASLRSTVIGGLLLVAVTLLVGALVTGNNLFACGLALTIGIGSLSLVLLSGYGGQVWLCQFTFMGLGAWAMTKVGGGDSVLGVLAAIGLCAAAGGILALPAIRLRALYMALATLAFAVLMDQLFFTNPSVLPSGSMTVGRPVIFGMHFTTDRAFMVFVAIVFAFCLVGVGALRRGPFGRRLVAMSDSQAACATVGMNIIRTRLVAFVVAGGLAGLSGALYGGMSRVVSFSQFSFVESLVLFVAVALAGITVLTGAVWAGLAVALLPVLTTWVTAHVWSGLSGLTYIGFGAGIIAVGRNPYGLGLLYIRLDEWREARRAGARPGRGVAGQPPSGIPGGLRTEVGSVG
ncbi:MAG TPA: ABC transporter permease [Acidimicrobiales bacterium]|nr:ABC transporter permease [Acidimicrobiales bacterium]